MDIPLSGAYVMHFDAECMGSLVNIINNKKVNKLVYKKLEAFNRLEIIMAPPDKTGRGVDSLLFYTDILGPVRQITFEPLPQVTCNSK